MDDVNFAGWTPEKWIKVVQGEAITRVLVKGQPYMSWPSGDEGCVRMAIVQLLRLRVGNSGRIGGSLWAARQFGAEIYYSPAQRVYLDQLEQGDYNAYAGGLLFTPLLKRYHFLPTLGEVIKIPTYEGYSLEELVLTLFYLDVFGFRSMEDFKRAYREEFGVPQIR